MNDREKQIEEMTIDIAPLIASQITLKKCTYLLQENQDKYNGMGWDADFKKIAEMLYDAGYRKMDEVTLKLDLGDRTPEEIKQIAEMFNGEIKKQVAKEILQYLFECANQGVQDENNDFAYACQQMKTKICFKAKQYDVEVVE